MKTISVRTLIEPLVYVALVAALGFITTVVSHACNTSPVNDTEIVTQANEEQLQEFFTVESEALNELSL